jgi:ribosomal protein S17E
MIPKTEMYEFEQKIDAIVQEKHLNYIDAIVDYCEENDFDIESVAQITSKSLKEKIASDAQSLNYLPKKSKLPI